MTGPELRAIREKLGLTPEAFGRALGFKGKSARIHTYHLEAGSKPITEQVARLAFMYGKHGVPKALRE